MTIEEYFVKEFKSYLDYKTHIINGANYIQDSRVNFIMNNLPPAEAALRDNGMRMQYNYLMGYDLGCQPDENGRVGFTEFIRKAMPKTVPIEQPGEAVDFCLLKDIKVPYFEKLNKSVVILQPRISYSKRITGNDGQFIKNADGEVMKRDIDIPKGSRVVLSHISIHLQNYTVNEHGRREYVDLPEGFGYIDYIEQEGTRKYLYYIPREYIYPMNLMALVLSQTRLTSRYTWGRRYFFNRGIDSAYLYIAPYSNSILKPNNIVFCLRADDNFEQEIKDLEMFWQSQVGAGNIPRPSILYPMEKLQLQTTMGNTQGGDCNLSYYTLPIPERPPYEKIGSSLAITDTDDMLG